MKRRAPSALWIVLLGAYAYAVTTVCAAWMLSRTPANGMSLATALAWQGLVYGLWLPVVGLLHLIVGRREPGPQTAFSVVAVGIVAVTLHSAASAMLDILFSVALKPADYTDLVIQRWPIDMMAFTALAAAVVAMAYQRRAAAAAERAHQLAERLRLARRTVADPLAAVPVQKLLVSTGSRRVLVDPAEVEWFGSAGNYVVVNWNGREGLVRTTLQALEARLDPAVFARIHRTTIVNLSKIDETMALSDGSWRLKTLSGVELHVGRTFRARLLATIGHRPS